MMVTDVLVLRGASPASVAITVELLHAANRLRRGDGRPPAFGVRLTGSGAPAARAFLDLRRQDEPAEAPAGLVVVPGLALTHEAALRDRLARPDAEAARRRIRRAHGEGAEVASSCSGVFLLASAGLLDGRRATTAWWLAPLFAAQYPRVRLETDAMVVRDPPVTTAGAAMAQLDLMLTLVARHGDAGLADRCARYLLLDRRPSQARYMAISYLTASDERLGRAERWARAHLGEPFPVNALADAAGLTPRTFARRLARVAGLSPVRFAQRIRVEQALDLLETTRLPFEEIARRVGYAEPSTLRRLLQREGARGAREIRGGAGAAAGAADATANLSWRQPTEHREPGAEMAVAGERQMKGPGP